MRFLAYALLVIATTYAEQVCEPGESQLNGSNICFCLGDGSGWVCVPAPAKKTRGGKKNEDTCEPGKPFMYYCNTCLCGTDGRADHAACTEMACDTNIWNKDGSIKLPNEIAGNPLLRETHDTEIHCEPGKEFKYYCNTCACGTDGRAACTKMYCDPQVWNKDGSVKLPNEIAGNPLLRETHDTEIHCEPGKKFKYYCNTCACGTDGRAACTKMYCDPQVWNKDGSVKLPNEITGNPLLRKTRDTEISCEPGKKFKYYCNTCACGTDGRAACTKMYCDPQVWNKDGSVKLPNEIAGNPLLRETQDTKIHCEPGKKFKYYCNTCACGTDGRAACTKMYCNPQVWNKDGSVKLPNEIAGNPLLSETRDTEISCEPGKKFKYYCNTCACGTDGRAACTKMYCDPQVWNKDGSVKLRNEITGNPLLRKTRDTEISCELGKKFKYYCNTCACGTDGRAACTKMYCDPQVWNKDGSVKLPNEIAGNPLLRETREIKGNQDTCEPGKKFNYYCNSCFCGPDGKVGNSVCTRMFCSPEIWNKDGSLKHPNGIANNPLPTKQRSTEFLCQPGKLFKDDCNTCSCGNDGKSAVCTFMLCPPRKDGRVPAPEVCEPRKHFNIDCNQCTCSEDGLQVACTQMACPQSAKQIVCEPNTTFRKDCNTCHCNSDGSAAACTLKLCF